jgi:hypothetical protein
VEFQNEYIPLKVKPYLIYTKMEAPKPVRNYEGIYEIYSDGRIYVIKRNMFKKYNTPNLAGREWIGLCKNGKMILYEKEYLIAEHYGKPIENFEQYFIYRDGRVRNSKSKKFLK